jgi:hypothetical protein
MAFVIYYSEDVEYSGPPEDAPARDVQIIVQDNPDVGSELVTSCDYYIWDTYLGDEGPRWRGVDLFGMYDYLLRPGWKRILMGRTISGEEYVRIYKKAQIKKEGWLRNEVRPSQLT